MLLVHVVLVSTEKYKHENSGGISIKKGQRWGFMVFQVWYDT